MARSSHYIQLPNGSRSTISAKRWQAYVAAGLLVVVDQAQRRARLRDSLVQARVVAGEMELFEVGARVKTNAEVIDRLWLLSEAGRQNLSEAEQHRVAAIRRQYGEDTRQSRRSDAPGTRAAVAEYLADQRKRRIQAELIRSTRTQIVVRRELLGAKPELEKEIYAREADTDNLLATTADCPRPGTA